MLTLFLNVPRDCQTPMASMPCLLGWTPFFPCCDKHLCILTLVSVVNPYAYVLSKKKILCKNYSHRNFYDCPQSLQRHRQQTICILSPWFCHCTKGCKSFQFWPIKTLSFTRPWPYPSSHPSGNTVRWMCWYIGPKAIQSSIWSWASTLFNSNMLEKHHISKKLMLKWNIFI